MSCCCKGNDDDDTRPQRYEEDRHCTDCLCFLLFVAFWAGFIAVAAVAYSNGHPERLIYGTDYLGYRCGNGGGPSNFSSYISPTSAWQSQTWSENTLLWYPIPQSLNVNFDAILDSAICVRTCPQLNSTVLSEIISRGEDFSSYPQVLLDYLTVSTYGALTVDNVTIFAPSRQYNLYSSKEFMFRCIPDGPSLATINETLHKLPYAAEINKFFFRGVSEIGSAWRVFLISFFICLVICFVYIFVMRYLVGVITWLALFAGFVLLALVGYAAWHRYTELRDDPNESDESQQYVDYYLAAAIISWIVAVVYVVVLLFLRKKIVLACAIVKISGRVVNSGPSLLIVPCITGVFIIAICAWCLSIAVYLYSADEFTYKPMIFAVFNDTVNDAYGAVSNYINDSGYMYANATIKITEISFSKRDLLFYDLFGFLWTMGFVNAVAFFVISFVAIFWYYSSLNDSEKAVPVGGVASAYWWTIRYHLGTIAFGSLIIAIIQFIRILLNYAYRKAKTLKENKTAKIIMCCANCILDCFERVVQIVSKNAYVITCITNKSFCCACADAFELILSNVVVIAILNVIMELVMLIGKVVVVSGTCLIAYELMDYQSLAPGVETRVLPLICIGFGSYFLAVVFFNVYSVVADANFVAYCYDRKANEATGMYFVPVELESQIDGFSRKLQQEEMVKKQNEAHAPK